MKNALQTESILLLRFREFYEEIVSLKTLVKSGVMHLGKTETKEVEGKVESFDVDLQVDTVWKRLMSLLEKQEHAVNRAAGEEVYGLYKASQFVMVALADEVFLELDWQGQEVWQSRLLETRFFKTNSAGEVFFKKLDVLLRHKNPINLELAKVYLMALALGFKGRYRGEASGAIELAHYREQVFSFVSRESSVFEDEESDYFCPHAYSHSLEEGLGLKLAYPNRWFIFLIFLIDQDKVPRNRFKIHLHM